MGQTRRESGTEEVGGEGRRGGVTHGFLLRVKCGDVEGARPSLLPVHRHHTAIVTG